MSAEFAILLDCPVRRAEGEDPVAATVALRRQVKARTLLDMMRSLAKKQGKLPFEVTIHHRVQTADGAETRELDWHSVQAECAGFEAKCAPCAECPANLLGRPLGCSGALKYPITEAVERWICDRMQGPETVGGMFLAQAIQTLGYDGERMASWRARPDLFERRTPVVRPFPDGSSISADQVFHAILGVGESLNPEHCLMLLLWLGRITIDGQVPGGPEDAVRVQALASTAPGDARRAAGAFVSEFPVESGDLTELQTLFAAMYQAWCAGAPLWIDA